MLMKLKNEYLVKGLTVLARIIAREEINNQTAKVSELSRLALISDISIILNKIAILKDFQSKHNIYNILLNKNNKEDGLRKWMNFIIINQAFQRIIQRKNINGKEGLKIEQ